MVAHSQQMEGSVYKGGAMEQNRNRVAGIWGKTGLWVLFLVGLSLSTAFPFGIGFVVFVWLIVLAGALFAVGFFSLGLFKDMLGKTATFGYAPTTAYMAGKKMKRRKKAETPDEQKKDAG